jgi:DNA invertase Pin-like site-specific DNA recombinase
VSADFAYQVVCTVELPTIAEDLAPPRHQLELLTGPLQGVYDPSGHGAALFAFFAGMAESEREYIHEKSLAGQASARERGRHGGRFVRRTRGHSSTVDGLAVCGC